MGGKGALQRVCQCRSAIKLGTWHGASEGHRISVVEVLLGTRQPVKAEGNEPASSEPGVAQQSQEARNAEICSIDASTSLPS